MEDKTRETNLTEEECAMVTGGAGSTSSSGSTKASSGKGDNGKDKEVITFPIAP